MAFNEITFNNIPYSYLKRNFGIETVYQKFLYFINSIKYTFILGIIMYLISIQKHTIKRYYNKIFKTYSTVSINNEKNNKNNDISLYHIIMNKNCKWIAIIVLFLITLFHTCSLKFSIPFTPFLILNNINLDISLYIDVIECIKKYVINFIVNVMSLLTTQIPMIIAFIILKINQSKKYNNYFINFLIIALLLNYQPPPPPSSSSYNNEKYHFNSTNNLDSKYDFLSSFEETSALWLNKLKIYDPLSYISFLNFPLVHAENINDNNNESITDANIVYNSTSSEDICK